MDWNTILETSAAVIVSFGGAGAIIAGVTKFAADKIADKLEKKYELKLSKELESFKSKLENRSYVSKTRIDAEFGIYRQLSVTAVTMVKEISQLFPRFTRDARNDYETYKGRYDTALEKTVVFQDTLAANAPFISEEVYLLFRNLEEKSKRQLGDFIDFRLRPDANDYVMECKEEYKEVWRRTQEIQSDLDTIIQKLREYLATLEVL